MVGCPLAIFSAQGRVTWFSVPDWPWHGNCNPCNELQTCFWLIQFPMLCKVHAPDILFKHTLPSGAMRVAWCYVTFTPKGTVVTVSLCEAGSGIWWKYNTFCNLLDPSTHFLNFVFLKKPLPILVDMKEYYRHLNPILLVGLRIETQLCAWFQAQWTWRPRTAGTSTPS